MSIDVEGAPRRLFTWPSFVAALAAATVMVVTAQLTEVHIDFSEAAPAVNLGSVLFTVLAPAVTLLFIPYTADDVKNAVFSTSSMLDHDEKHRSQRVLLLFADVLPLLGLLSAISGMIFVAVHLNDSSRLFSNFSSASTGLAFGCALGWVARLRARSVDFTSLLVALAGHAILVSTFFMTMYAVTAADYTRLRRASVSGVSRERAHSCDGNWKAGFCIEARVGKEQIVRLTDVRSIEETRDGLRIVGKGSAKIDGGSGAFFWNSTTPPDVELVLRLGGPGETKNCEDLIRSRQPVEIDGFGTFYARDDALPGHPAGNFDLRFVLLCASVR
jgi:hypothetical protein